MRRNREERLAFEQPVWTLRVKGFTQATIAKTLGLSQGYVSKILARLSRHAMREMTESILERKAEQVEQLEHVAQEAMKAWERSKEASITLQQRMAIRASVNGT